MSLPSCRQWHGRPQQLPEGRSAQHWPLAAPQQEPPGQVGLKVIRDLLPVPVLVQGRLLRIILIAQEHGQQDEVGEGTRRGCCTGPFKFRQTETGHKAGFGCGGKHRLTVLSGLHHQLRLRPLGSLQAVSCQQFKGRFFPLPKINLNTSSISILLLKFYASNVHIINQNN